MKKLANFSKNSEGHNASKRNGHAKPSQTKKVPKRSPYMNGVPSLRGSASQVDNMTGAHQSLSIIPTRPTASFDTTYRPRPLSAGSDIEGTGQAYKARSTAATISTKDGEERPDASTSRSVAAPSHAPSSGEGTSATIGAGTTGRGADSTFSSPSPSLRSLTTTLTTVHSTSNALGAATNTNASNGGHHNNHGTSAASVHFSHQYPISPAPATALPAHLQSQVAGPYPPTYNTVTANNLLTDNASILTLASSSKRRRRRSMDTDASVRAIPPSSLFGGSRESLPLSVLSSTIQPVDPGSSSAATGLQARIGHDRASIYSATGVTAALPSERNSLYAGKAMLSDGGSMYSGRLGHGRAESISGSLTGVGSPLASPRDAPLASAGNRLSRATAAGVSAGVEDDVQEASEADDEVGAEREKLAMDHVGAKA
jgi:hypothetical protein